MVPHVATVCINRVWLPTLLVVSSTEKNDVSLSAFAPEKWVSQDGFGSPVPRQPAHLQTLAESGAYLRDSSRVWTSRPASASSFFTLKLDRLFTHGIIPISAAEPIFYGHVLCTTVYCYDNMTFNIKVVPAPVISLQAAPVTPVVWLVFRKYYFGENSKEQTGPVCPSTLLPDRDVFLHS